MVEVTLYTKAGCGLCEEVKENLAELAAVYPHHLTEIDITAGRALFQQYCFSIPVVHVGTAVLAAPITKTQLSAALKKLS